MKPPHAIESVPNLSGRAVAYRWHLSLPRIPNIHGQVSLHIMPGFVSLRMCECVSVFSSNLFWTTSSLGVPAGVTQEEGHTEFLFYLPFAVRALIFLARRIQLFLFLVDRQSDFVY